MTKTIEIARCEIDEDAEIPEGYTLKENMEFLESEEIDERRWVTGYIHYFVDKETGKFYRFDYERPNTECCDAEYYGNEDYITGIEVEKREVKVTQFFDVV